jgi:putative transposase
MYPTGEQAGVMLGHCAHARYVYNLAVEQHTHWYRGRRAAPGFAEQCRQLTEARRDNEWLGAGNADVQQQALKDFAKAKNARFTSGFGEPTWRRKHVHEGFRVIGTGRIGEFEADGSPKLNAKTGKQVMGRSVVVRKLNRRWARVKVPGCGWVRFRLSRKGKGSELPKAKTFRVTFRNGQWHIAFAVVPAPIDGPGTGEVIGIDRGVKITAALSDGRKLNCPQLTVRERARIRKHQRRAARAPKGSEHKSAEYAKAARIKAREADRRRDWCEKTSTMLARTYDLVRFEKLNVKNMTASAKGTIEQPGQMVRQRACSGSAPGTRPRAGSRTSPPPTPVCAAASAVGSTRTRARAKPSSSAPPAASPATPTPTQQSMSRQDRAGSPAPGEQPVPEG